MRRLLALTLAAVAALTLSTAQTGASVGIPDEFIIPQFTPPHNWELPADPPSTSYGDERREPTTVFSWSEETTGGHVPEGLTIDPNWDAVVNDHARTEPYLPPYKADRPEWRCDGWMDLARRVGWPEEELPKLSYVIYRESRCDPMAFNPDDPMGGSLGLTQLNRFWTQPTRYWPEGWLVTHGILEHADELYNPYVSLNASLAVWNNSGWNPWGM